MNQKRGYFMAEIKAFRGMRYNTERAGKLDELCCPPYDIISEKERKNYLAQNKYNVIRLELPKEGDDVYKTAGEVLDRWREKGILIHEDKPAVYIYEEEFNAYNTRRSIKGLIARVKVEEFSKGVILPHEFTLSKAKADRFNLMKATNCNFSQIYALYMDEEHTTRENGISKEGDAQDYQMMFLMDMEHPGLVVFPTHRMVRDLPKFDRDKILDGCEEYFDIKAFDSVSHMNELLHAEYKKGSKSFGFYCGKGEWYLLTLKDIGVMKQELPNLSEASQQLDVSVLHTLILEKILGIDKQNMAAQINLTYTKFYEEAIMGVDKGEFQCSFILNPTRVTEIRDVAAAGEKMPQKSTYFYPKMTTGMVMNDIGVE